MRRLLTAVLLALAFPAAASAHATLVRTTPGIQQRVASSPTRVSLSFDQSVKALPNAIRVYSAKGRLVSGETLTSNGKRTIDAPVSRLPRGAYTVRWTAISADGHVISGVFTFGVRHRAPPATEAFGASGPTTEEHIVRWLYFLALALLAGGLGFRLLVLRGPLRPETERRFYRRAGGRRGRGDRGRDLRLPASRRGRAAASVREIPVRRPDADRRRHPLRRRPSWR